MISFGSVFRYRENLYVYLVQVDDLIFAARILDRETTDALVKARDNKGKSPKNRIQDNPMYCFVILSTDEFRGQAAHYHQQLPTDSQPEELRVLSKEDIEALKNEIYTDTATFPALRKAVETIFAKNKEESNVST